MRPALLILTAGVALAQSPSEQAEALWKARRYDEASKAFEAAVKADPKNPSLHVRWGRLFLERFNKAEAVQEFQTARELKADYPPALLGQALVAAESFDSQAVELAEKALAGDSKLTEARQLLARLALEHSDYERAAAEAAKIQYTAVPFIIDRLHDREPKQVPAEAEGYALAGSIFVLNRRYEEAIQFYQKALELDPKLDRARAELGVQLMRLGRDDQARKELEQAYLNGFRNAMTVNSLTLMDSYKNFVVRRTDNTVVKAHRKEADLVGPYVEAELKRAIATFEKKYRLKLTEPVQVELYPLHEDFAVRTLGLPGLGALGVTFGHVVAMDSPSGRKPGTFHWASTLWHELSHVYVLTATKHRVPRWFTEGMAVHEETAVSPEWGDRLDPVVINAIRQKKLLPVAELDRGFVRPSYRGQVVVSYFEAGRICDFINEKWGYTKLLDMMHAFSTLKPTSAVIEEQLGMKTAEFDQKFLAWLDAQVGQTVSKFAEWQKMLREVAEAAAAKRYDDVLRLGPAVRQLYPEHVEITSVYQLIADAHLARGDKAAAMAELEKWARAGGREPELLKRLAKMQEEAGDRRAAIRTWQRLVYVYPLDEELHTRLGDLLLAEGDAKGAVFEYEALIAAKPLDQAATRFNLARALRASNRIEDAKEQLLLALEAAPGYKPAQRMLLELNK
ncbi:MAG TPA: tetratricopeptide repeat protein [Bryobacteraceae bacterium]|nr:tetratricopeptide repeat protein [Bryobacteraceae bacterium]